MLPNKLQHGDTLASLLQKYNEMVDYLRETRLVAGPGMRINRHPSGTTIESTATATGGTPPIPPEGHPFDAELINKGTDESPNYYVHIYNSALPDSPYAGVVFVGDWDINVPVTELAVNTQNGFYVALDVAYTGTGRPPFSVTLSIIPYGSGGEVGYTTYREYIAEGKLPDVASRKNGDVSVTGRWA